MPTILRTAAVGIATVLISGCSSGDAASTGAPGAGGQTGDAAGAGGIDAASGSGGSAGGDAAMDGGAGADSTEVAASSRSCAGGLLCNGESCCTSITVPGGTFPQGRSLVAGASDYLDPSSPFSGPSNSDVPEHSATVSSFALDKYEVTVGRFRAFVDAYVDNVTSAPAEGAGANRAIAASGWQPPWNMSLPATRAAFTDSSHLNACAAAGPWTDSPGPNENKPVNCVSWYEAFAFCTWDGGRLATESEWEYAAAGGSENRLYPWGAAEPDCTFANFVYDVTPCSGAVVAVGSTPNGNGRWGHADLGGNLWEWGLDYFADYSAAASVDYANTSSGAYRIVRGGAENHDFARMRSAHRNFNVADAHFPTHGLRCARAAR
jgi:formylglycine-generating enzyme